MPTLVDEQDVRQALDEPAVWPNLSQAAGIIGLTKSTLSKHASAGEIEYRVLGLGRGRYALAPGEVLRIGRRYHRIPDETIVDRLTTFLMPRLQAESNLIRRALCLTMERVVSRETFGRSGPDGRGQRVSQPRQSTVPAWLSNVEPLRTEPTALAGHFSFASSEDVVGQIRFGPLIDDVEDVTRTDW